MPRKTVTRGCRSDTSKASVPDAGQREWDRRTGTPRDAKAAQKVDRAYSRYSASEQAEEQRKRRR